MIFYRTEELIKIFVTSIKTAEKKSRLGVIGRSMFDVHLKKPRFQPAMSFRSFTFF